MQHIIGITGGIGSGKSTIARELAKRGYSIYDCDREAKRIIAENAEVQQAITDLLGQEAFINGQYNTKYVAQRVFEDPTLLAQLNAIVHPKVKEDICQRKPDFVESAILFEAGLDALCDKVFIIDAPEEIRIARTIHRDYHGEHTPENINKVRARIRAQAFKDESKAKTERILNDGNTPLDALICRILQDI